MSVSILRVCSGGGLLPALLARTILVVGAAAMSGCASFRAHEVVKTARFVDEKAMNVQTVYVHAVTSDVFTDFNRTTTADQSILQMIDCGVDGVPVVALYRTDMTEYVKTEDGRGSMALYSARRIPTNVLQRLGDHDVVMIITAKTVMHNLPLTVANAVLTGFTFTLVPCVGRLSVSINANAYDKTGTKIWSGNYSEDVRRAVWLFLAHKMFTKDNIFREPGKHGEICKDLTVDAIHDLRSGTDVRRQIEEE